MDKKDVLVRATRAIALAGGIGFGVTALFVALDNLQTQCDTGLPCHQAVDVFGSAEALGWIAFGLLVPALVFTPVPLGRLALPAAVVQALFFGAFVGYFTFLLAVPAERSHDESTLGFAAAALTAVGVFLWSFTKIWGRPTASTMAPETPPAGPGI